MFTDDGRYVNAGAAVHADIPLEGFSGEELKARVERRGGWQEYERTGTPLISWRDNSEAGRPNTYYAVEMLRPFAEMPSETIELYNIIDENGTLKFRYVEGWAPLGWFKLSEDSPYIGVADPDNQLHFGVPLVSTSRVEEVVERVGERGAGRGGDGTRRRNGPERGAALLAIAAAWRQTAA